MSDKKISNAILLEVTINGLRICPTFTDDAKWFYDLANMDSKTQAELMAKGEFTAEDVAVNKKILSHKVELSKIEVESVDIEYGAVSYSIEVRLFDPTMSAVDYILYGFKDSSYINQKISVRIGWFTEGGGKLKSKVFGGMLTGAAPVVMAGGMSYTLSYVNEYIVPGASKKDAIFPEPLYSLEDFGELTLPDGYDIVEKVIGVLPEHSQYDDGVKYVETFRIKEGFKFLLQWEMFEKIPMLLTKSMYDMYKSNIESGLYTASDERIAKQYGRMVIKGNKRVDNKNVRTETPVTWVSVKVNGEDKRLFTSQFIDIMLKKEYPTEKVWDAFMKAGHVLKDFPVSDYNYKEYWGTTVDSGKKLVSVHKLDRRVLSNDDVAFVLKPVNPYGTFNIFHMLFCFAALYGFEIKISDDLLRDGDVKISVENFVSNRVVPFFWHTWLDYIDSGMGDKLKKLVEFSSDLDKYIGNYIRVERFGAPQATALRLAAKNFLVGVSHDFFKKLFVSVLQNEDFSSTTLLGITIPISKGILFERYIRDGNPVYTYRIKSDTAYSYYKQGSTADLSYYDFNLYNTQVINRIGNTDIITYLKEQFEKYGCYYEKDLKTVSGELAKGGDVPLHRLYLCVSSEEKGNSVIRISGEPTVTAVKETKVFEFPRQSEEGTVTAFDVEASTAFFIPWGNVDIYKDYFNINGATNRTSVSKAEKPLGFQGEGVQGLLDRVSSEKLKRYAAGTDNLHTKMLLTSVYSNMAGNTKYFDTAKAVKVEQSRLHTDAYRATLSLLGNVDVELFEYIYVVVNKPSPTFELHHLSGMYLVLGIRHSIHGGSFITELRLTKTSTYNGGDPTLVDGVQTFFIDDTKYWFNPELKDDK